MSTSVPTIGDPTGSNLDVKDQDINWGWWVKNIIVPVVVVSVFIGLYVLLYNSYKKRFGTDSTDEEEVDDSDLKDTKPTPTKPILNESSTTFYKLVETVTQKYKQLVSEGNAMTSNEIKNLDEGLTDEEKEKEINEIMESGEKRVNIFISKRADEIMTNVPKFTQAAIFKACIDLAENNLLLFKPEHNPEEAEEKAMADLEANNVDASKTNDNTPDNSPTEVVTGPEAKEEVKEDQKEEVKEDPAPIKESFYSALTSDCRYMTEQRDKSDQRDPYGYLSFDYYGVKNPNYWNEEGNHYDEEISRNLFKYNMQYMQ